MTAEEIVLEMKRFNPSVYIIICSGYKISKKLSNTLSTDLFVNHLDSIFREKLFLHKFF